MSGSGAPQSQAFLEEWLLRTQEQIDKFRPDILWFDNGVNARGLDPVKLRLAAYYYNSAASWGKEVTLSTKQQAFLAGSVRDYERQWQAPASLQPEAFQVDDALGDKWGYVEGMGALSAQTVIFRLVENVSRGGNLLLNVSPKSDGTLPEIQVAALKEIGQWLAVNGEAIYGTRPWKRDNDDIIRYTRKGDTLYAIILGWPNNPALNISSLPQNVGKVTRVTLLGATQPLEFKQNDAGMTVSLPERKPGRYAHALRIEGLKLDTNAGH
jgi:alpha-L-fucosidase